MSGTTTAPALTFERAQSLFEDWPDDDFVEMVDQATLTVRNPEKVKAALKDLDYTQPIDRWYGACVLLEHKAKLPGGHK